MLKYPELYKTSQNAMGFNTKVMRAYFMVLFLQDQIQTEHFWYIYFAMLMAFLFSPMFSFVLFFCYSNTT